MNKIEEYYNKFNEEKRLNSRHGQIEYRITMKYIHDYLDVRMQELKVANREDIKILDIGAGTGRYSVALCEEGYDEAEKQQRACDAGKCAASEEAGR